jgi:hypothetical protein
MFKPIEIHTLVRADGALLALKQHPIRGAKVLGPVDQ